MKFGIFLSTMGNWADPEIVLKYATKVEEQGFDGVFLPDHLHYGNRNQYGKGTLAFLDPWIMLSAIATRTKRIKLGTWITPLPRRLPWQLARDLATLDVLSKGRVILGAGLGTPPEDYEDYGIAYNLKELGEKLDESLDILEGLWQEGKFSYDGKHYQIKNVDLKPKPVQKPRIPIMIATKGLAKKPIHRGAKYDGIMPIGKNFPDYMGNESLKELVSYFRGYSAEGSIFIPYKDIMENGPPLQEFVTLCEEFTIDWLLLPLGPMIGSFKENDEILNSYKQALLVNKRML